MTEFFVALLYFISSFFTLLVTDAERIPEIPYNQPVNFESISAEDIPLTDEEKKSCREWYDEKILLRGGETDLPYNFRIGGKSLSQNIYDWTFSVSEESEKGAVYNGGKTSYITLKHNSSGVVATVEATIYEDNATCEWTVFIKNTDDENSPVVSDFYALDESFETGETTVYYSKGSRDEPYDFALMKKNLNAIPANFDSIEGRSTDNYLPYFNISGGKGDLILGVGWSGFWKTSMKEISGKTSIKVGQETFKAYLLPEEEVRSPLVSLSFYNNENPLKGFNVFRTWVLDSVYPENIPDVMTMMEVAGPLSTNTASQIIDTMNTFKKKVFEEVDYFWMDAGWYEYNEGWHDAVGTWVPDKNRYPNGICEISDYGKEKGCGLVLWYEPERVRVNSELYNSVIGKPQWLLDLGDDENLLYNFANDEAVDYLCELIVTSLKDNGVSLYRQDFNIAPVEFWETADKEYYDGRKGITENHYITNEYRYLDYLTENIDGLIIDNCAAGGRRLDLEMTRRSVPVWRSDYNCVPHEDILEATQAHTYGLSFWLPLSGTVQYNYDEYSARSSIMPLTLETFGTIYSEYFSVYKEQRTMMSGNFYPLEWGGYSDEKILAMQYSSEDALTGEALVYKRENVKDTEYTLHLNGLVGDKEYEVYSIDEPESIYRITGEKLMNEGIKLQLPEGKKAFVIMFSAK